MPYRAPIHQPIVWRPPQVTRQREGDRFYKTTAWRQLRMSVLVRDQFRCQLVLPRCEVKASIADHIIEREDGGPDVMSNLRSACPSCHNKRHSDRWKNRDT